MGFILGHCLVLVRGSYRVFRVSSLKLLGESILGYLDRYNGLLLFVKLLTFLKA